MPKTGSSQIPAKVDLRSFSKKMQTGWFRMEGSDLGAISCWKKTYPVQKGIFWVDDFCAARDEQNEFFGIAISYIQKKKTGKLSETVRWVLGTLHTRWTLVNKPKKNKTDWYMGVS